jgi:hypothetical protein
MKSLAEQILWAIFIVLFMLWLVAAGMHLTGGLITYLLVIALVVLLVRTTYSRSRAAARKTVAKRERAA